MSEWERCSHWIQAALDRSGNTHTLDEVKAEVEAHRAIFVPMDDHAFVCIVEKLPRVSVLNVWLLGGEFPGLHEHADLLTEIARSQGCTRLRVPEARVGWLRRTRAIGLSRFWVVLEKDI